jgi:hypothetical protein
LVLENQVLGYTLREQKTIEGGPLSSPSPLTQGLQTCEKCFTDTLALKKSMLFKQLQ